MEQWSYRDMIDLYLDGELPADHRAALFSALATNDELQAEFHQAWTIRIAALQESLRLTPSPTLTARILAAAAPQRSAISDSRKRHWQLKFFQTAAIVATAAMLGFVVGRLTAPPGAASPAVHASASSEYHELSRSDAQMHTNALSFKQSRFRKQATAVGDQQQPPSRQSMHQREQSIPAPDVPLPQDVRLPQSELPPTPSQQSVVEPIPPRVVPNLPHRLPPVVDPQQQPATDAHIIVSLRRTNTILLRQQRLVEPLSSAPFNNTIVSLEYRAQNVGVFIQGGYEQFPLYEVTAAADGVTRYILHQQLWWVGGGMRAYMPMDEQDNILRTIRPVAGILLGTSAYGILGRGELGIVWEPLPTIGVQFLLEGMVHSHSAGTSWEHAEKLSGSIGLAFRF